MGLNLACDPMYVMRGRWCYMKILTSCTARWETGDFNLSHARSSKDTAMGNLLGRGRSQGGRRAVEDVITVEMLSALAGRYMPKSKRTLPTTWRRRHGGRMLRHTGCRRTWLMAVGCLLADGVGPAGAGRVGGRKGISAL